jgi:hypothetical protein
MAAVDIAPSATVHSAAHTASSVMVGSGPRRCRTMGCNREELSETDAALCIAIGGSGVVFGPHIHE